MRSAHFFRMLNVNFRTVATAVLVFVIVLWMLSSRYQGGTSHREALGGKVNVTVYYEALCPDSKHFLLQQLKPTWEKLSDVMYIDLRPFGKATFKKRESGSGYEFSCQHGPDECLANLVHNCGIRHVADFFPYIACMMVDNEVPLEIGKKCAEELNVDWDKVKKCAQSVEGEDLMAYAGETTLPLKATFIPTVALNGDFGRQSSILKNLRREVCNAFKGPEPENCAGVN